jgi:endonuclease YncB( thermonuclease family)
MRSRAVINVLALLSAISSGRQYPAKVTHITDGDSLRVLHDGQELTIRLEGIDCPELGQAFGTKAKQAASKLAHGKAVTIQPTGKDKYGRTLANIILPDGTT